MTDEWTRAEKRKAQSEQAKAIMDFVSMLSDKINDLEKENAELKKRYDKVDVIGYDALKNLTKAKELLAKWVELFKPKGGNIPPTPIQVDTEQFLKGE